MEGWLTKKGHLFKTWKRRWFVLDTSKGFVLNYYEKENKKSLKGTYILSGSSHITRTDDERGHSNLFVLHATGSGGDELVMSADSPEEMQDWITGTEHIIRMCKETIERADSPQLSLSPAAYPSPAPVTHASLSRIGNGDIATALASFPKHGLTLAGLHEFISLCGGPGELLELTTTDVCEKFVKRQTASSKQSYCSKLHCAGSNKVGIATHFISHAWKYEFLDTVGAITDFFENDPNVVVWFDIFSNNQHIAPKFDCNWWSTTFQAAIQQFGHTVVVFSPWDSPIPLSRAWCLFELYCSTADDCHLDVAMCKRDFNMFLNTTARDMEHYFKMFCNIDVRKSESMNPGDKEQIFETIERTIGFSSINNMISEKLQKWVIRVLESSTTGAAPDVLLMRTVALAEILRLQGSFLPALDYYREALAEADELGDPSMDWVCATCYNGIGQVYDSRGRHKESLEYYQKSLDKRILIQGDVGSVYNNMAVAYANQGNYSDALEYYDKALQMLKSKHGVVHPDVGACYRNMAVAYTNRENYEDALTCYEKSLNIDKTILGTSHPNVGGVFCNMATLEDMRENYDQALLLYDKALELFAPTLGPMHPSVGGVYFNRAMVFSSMGDIDKVIDSYQRALKIFKCTYGESHACIGDIHMNIAGVHASQGNYDDALIDFDNALQVFIGTGEHDINVGNIYNGMAMIYYSQEKYQEALHHFEKALAVKLSQEEVTALDVGAIYNTMGFIHQYLSEFEAALDSYLKAEPIFTAAHDSADDVLASVYRHIISVYEALGNRKMAGKYRQLLSKYM